ncbi:MAG: sigma-70 family RNA polymerase sigma factor [Myxococcota bacterium]
MLQPLSIVEEEPPAGDSSPAVVIPLPKSDDPDRALLERHRGGDRDAFAKLMKKFSGSVYGYLTRAGVPAAERDDLFQDVFCKVHVGARRKMPDGPVFPWVLRIAVNAVRDHHRRTKVRSVVKLDGEADERQSPSLSADRALEAKETARFMELQVQKLPLPQREALLLASVAGLGTKGAASVLGEPLETIKTRLRRARRSLAEAMRRREQTMLREESQ